jgi:hypothetical protein
MRTRNGSAMVDVYLGRILKIFSPKILEKKMAFLSQNKAKFVKNFIITLVYEKNANFFAENCLKSQKIVIITSTPGFAVV